MAHTSRIGRIQYTKDIPFQINTKQNNVQEEIKRYKQDVDSYCQETNNGSKNSPKYDKLTKFMSKTVPNKVCYPGATKYNVAYDRTTPNPNKKRLKLNYFFPQYRDMRRVRGGYGCNSKITNYLIT